jgi:hypothetical protein
MASVSRGLPEGSTPIVAGNVSTGTQFLTLVEMLGIGTDQYR